MSDPLIAHLAERDEPCPVCSYNLKGIPSPACPECAAPLHLAVASTHNTLGPWLLAVISAALALGFDSVVSLLLFTANAASYLNTATFVLQPLLMLLFFSLLASAMGLALAMILRRRRTWALHSPRAQWTRAWLTFAAVGLAHLGFAVLLVSLVV